MIPSFHEKHYASLHKKSLDAACDRLLIECLPNITGKYMRKLIVDELIKLFHTYTIPSERLEPGQMLWTAVDVTTRASSKDAKYKPVVLTLLTSDEIDIMKSGKRSPPSLFPDTIARLCEEAYAQGALLSVRDIAVITKRDLAETSKRKLEYEQRTQRTIPNVGSIHDMGTTISHKNLILRKILIEKKDMNTVRRETHHTQRAIDHYLRDYRRVEMLLNESKSIEYITQITRLSKHLIKQYVILYKEVNNATSKAA